MFTAIAKDPTNDRVLARESFGSLEKAVEYAELGSLIGGMTVEVWEERDGASHQVTPREAYERMGFPIDDDGEVYDA